MAKQKVPVQSRGGVLELPAPPPRKATEYLNAYKSWVYTAVSVIAQDVSTVPLKLFTKKYKGGEITIDEVMDHEAFSVLYHANDFMTKEMLLEITAIYVLLVGEAYWVKLRDPSGKVAELWPLRPDWVKVKPSKDNYIDGYIYDPGGNAPKVEFPINDIVPFKDLNPRDAYRGYGAVQAGAMAIDTDEFSADWNRTFFYNSALPGIVFTTDGRLTQAQIDRFLTQWKANFGGHGKGHKVAFLSGGLKPEPLTNTPRDMDFLEQRRFLRDEILAMFRVPKSVIGITEDVNRANAEATLRSYMERVVTPRLMKIVGHLNEFYLTEWGDDFFFDFDDPSPEDIEINLKIYESGLQNGWMTINEVRDRENLPPLEGGDTVYLPFSLQPLGSVIESVRGFFGKKKDEESGVITLKSTGTEKERKFIMPIPPKRLRELREEQFKSDIKRDLHKLILHNLKVVKTEQDLKPMFSENQKEIFWKEMVAVTDVQESRMKQMLGKLFADQESEVLSKLDKVKYYPRTKRDGTEEDYVFDEEEEERVWLLLLAPFIKKVFMDRGLKILQTLGVESGFDINTPSAADFISDEGLRFIKQANRTTLEGLKKTLSDGLAGGESIDQLRERVQSVFSIASKARSETIARTEVLRATNSATEEAYKQSGVVQGKEWIAALDERTRTEHADANGQIVPINEDFIVGGERLSQPGDVRGSAWNTINCRCSIGPVMAVKKVDSEDEKLNELSKKVTKKLEEKAMKKEIEGIVSEGRRVLESMTNKETEAETKLKEAERGVEESKLRAEKILAEAERGAEEVLENAKGEAESMREDAKEDKKNLLDEIKGLRDKLVEKING